MHLHKMNTDPLFMVPFVQLIEKYPALYDATCDGYSDRIFLESIWTEISRSVGESVNNCKERWRNIRSSYTRWLRSEVMVASGGRRKKPYYLAKHLKFLGNHAKIKVLAVDQKSSNSIKTELNNDSNDSLQKPNFSKVDEELFENSENQSVEETVCDDEISIGHSDAETDHMDTSSKERYFEVFRKMEADRKKRIRDHTESYQDHFSWKRRATEEEHPTFLFFKSIMSDVKKLNDKQSLQLKLLILEKLKEYTEENENANRKPSTSRLEQ